MQYFCTPVSGTYWNAGFSASNTHFELKQSFRIKVERRCRRHCCWQTVWNACKWETNQDIVRIEVCLYVREVDCTAAAVAVNFVRTNIRPIDKINTLSKSITAACYSVASHAHLQLCCAGKKLPPRRENIVKASWREWECGKREKWNDYLKSNYSDKSLLAAR